MKPPVILAFLQNQWVKNPERVKEIFARNPSRRNELIRRFLFAGCLTGRRLWEAFGETLCSRIIWEEISPEIGGHASSIFPSDFAHMGNAVVKHEPDIIVALGMPARTAVERLLRENGWQSLIVVVEGMHPAARHPDVMESLKFTGDLIQRLGGVAC